MASLKGQQSITVNAKEYLEWPVQRELNVPLVLNTDVTRWYGQIAEYLYTETDKDTYGLIEGVSVDGSYNTPEMTDDYWTRAGLIRGPTWEMKTSLLQTTEEGLIQYPKFIFSASNIRNLLYFNGFLVVAICSRIGRQWKIEYRRKNCREWFDALNQKEKFNRLVHQAATKTPSQWSVWHRVTGTGNALFPSKKRKYNIL